MASKDIPDDYNPVREVERFLAISSDQRFPPNGTVFTPDADGHAIFSTVAGGIPGRHIGQYPDRQAPSEKLRIGMIDRIIEKVFTLLDRWSLRI